MTTLPRNTLIAAILMGSTACTPPPLVLKVESICPAPIEVDHTQSLLDDGTSELYYAEEMLVTFSAAKDLYFMEERRPVVEYIKYRVDYELLNQSGSMESYSNGMQATISQDEVNAVWARVVSFDQKDWAQAEFGPTSEINVRGTLTLFGQDQHGAEYETIGDFDIIFANFLRDPEGGTEESVCTTD